MDAKEMRSLAIECFTAAEDVNDKDAVMGAMFSKGIPFGQIIGLYKTVGIEENFIIDPAVIRSGIDEKIADAEITSFDSYEEVETLSKEIAKAVEGSSALQVVKKIKTYCKDNEVEFPRKSRELGPRKLRSGTMISAAVDYAFNTPASDMNKKDLYALIRKNTATAKNAFDQTNNAYPLVYGVRAGLDFADLAKAMADVTPLNLAELEAAEADTTED